MADLIEGRNPVLEALRAGIALEEVLVSSGARDNSILDEIRRACSDAGVVLREVPRHELDRLSTRGAHQGVVARAAAFGYTPLDTLLDAIAGRADATVVVLDHVTDPGNLGAVIRSAEALGAHGVIIPNVRAASVGPVVMKTSAGATAHIPVVQVTNVARTLAALKEADFWVAGASEHAEQPVWDARLDGRLAIVLGSEGAGISRLVREACDFLVSVPLRGKTSSLNVAQAATVLLYERGRGTEA